MRDFLTASECFDLTNSSIKELILENKLLKDRIVKIYQEEILPAVLNGRFCVSSKHFYNLEKDDYVKLKEFFLTMGFELSYDVDINISWGCSK